MTVAGAPPLPVLPWVSVSAMPLIRLALPLAAAALVLTACSSDTEESADASADASAQTCSYEETVDGVTALREPDSDPQLTVAKNAKRPKELVAVDLCEGSGETAGGADIVVVDYVGVGYKSREVFDSSFLRGQPAEFPLNGVIPGWSEGVSGMAPGGARLLLIPAELAYGKAGAPPASAPNEDLAFSVELDDVGSSAAVDPAGP